MKRIYEAVLDEHFSKYDQMAFLSGPRQVGKTTVAKNILKHMGTRSKYLNWDILSDRKCILEDYESVLENLSLDLVSDKKPFLVLDEIHKYKHWKNWLKGLSDLTKSHLNLLVTGSSKLNTFRRGGDSLMGRYFLYRVHPFSVAELLRTEMPDKLFSMPQKLDSDQFEALYQFGGFPEAFRTAEKRFYHRWQNLRLEQLFREDIRNMEQVEDIGQMELLAFQLRFNASQLLNYSNMANKVRVSDQTIRRWIRILESFYYCFTLTPYSQNIARSILKEPKVFLWDWSLVEDPGSRYENFIACHLLKAVHFWNDIGFGSFALHYVRDKEKREVDFLIIKDHKPWMLIEAKSSQKEPLSESLKHYQKQLNAEIVLQVALDADYSEQDCFNLSKPVIVSAKTLLSQLI
ncbi:MAG: ATP-binding protein [Myxococcaceae bacterium]